MSSMNLYVGNLSYDTSEAKLNDMFAEFGEVLSAKIIMDRFSGRSKGFGFVEMADRGEAEKAVAELNGKEIDGRPIKVNEAKPRSDNRRGGGGGGGYGGGRDRY
jgi:cold-inducible RNA-binding protein